MNILMVLAVALLFGASLFCAFWFHDTMEEQPCVCTVNVGNQTLTIEDAFEYVTKGLSAHQWLEVQQAINQSCEVK